MKRIQTIDLTSGPDHRLHCPFCGQAVLPLADEMADAEAPVVEPCAHTLFVVGQETALYRSPRFDTYLELEEVPDSEVALPKGGWPELCGGIALPDAVRFVVAEAPLGYSELHIGFAPISPQAGSD
jgi:hypothetical protein